MIRLKGRELSLQVFIDGRPVGEAVPMHAENIEIILPEPPAPTRDRLTLDDWIAAKAPLDHAPCAEAPYLFVDGRWVQDWPMPGDMAPIRRDLDATTALWCCSVALTRDRVQSGQVSP